MHARVRAYMQKTAHNAEVAITTHVPGFECKAREWLYTGPNNGELLMPIPRAAPCVQLLGCHTRNKPIDACRAFVSLPKGLAKEERILLPRINTCKHAERCEKVWGLDLRFTGLQDQGVRQGQRPQCSEPFY